MGGRIRSFLILVFALTTISVIPACNNTGTSNSGDDSATAGEDMNTNGVEDSNTNGQSGDNQASSNGVPGEVEPVPYTGDYVFDPDIYVADVDPDFVLSMAVGLEDTPDIQFPANQLIAILYAGSPRSEAERVAELVGGTIVGQVPSQDYYQIELSTSTQAELDAALAIVQADDMVEEASYNLMVEQATVCPSPCDLWDQLYLTDDRCAFYDIDYYSAITIFDQIRDELFFYPVIVAVVDTGIQAENGEFDEVTVINLNDPDNAATDTYTHGTKVASLIAADDDGAGINGIASRFLEGNVILLSGGALGNTHAHYYAAAERALVAGAQIVNMSFGWAHYNTGIDLAAIRTAWRNMFENNPDVLFVTAADNVRYEITASNYAPGGINLPNVLTVGGTAACAPQDAWADSATGPRVDIAAPSQTIPCAAKADGHSVVYASGNSLATPMVTSLATILKSIYPDLTAEEIKEDYIRYYAYPTSEDIGGARISMAICIEQALIDRSPSVSNTVLDLIDNDINDQHDLPGFVMNRICGGFNYQVEGAGNGYYEYPGAEINVDGVHISGTVGAESFAINSQVPEEASLILGCYEGAGCIFELEREFVIHRDAVDIPGYVGVAYEKRPSESPPEAIGIGTGGSVVFESCRIDQRFGEDNRIILVNMTGQFKGTLETVVPPDHLLYSSGLEGYFTIPFVVSGLGVEDALQQYLESNCEGGYPDGNPGA